MVRRQHALDTPNMFHHRLFPSARAVKRMASSGLTRVELIWIAVCGIVVTAIILGTLAADIGNAQMRRAQDHLQYLVGQLRYTVEVDPERGADWPSLMLGPGAPPSGIEPPASHSLAEVLPPEHYVPVDPWGHAYLMQRSPDGNGWTIGSSGPAGEIDDLDAWGSHASQPNSLVRLLIVPR
jgi:hypothetical protein